jgi:hypothetical protein
MGRTSEMEHTEQQEAEFRQQFSIRRKRQIILAIPLVALMVGFAVLTDEGSGTIAGLPPSVAGPGLIVLVAGAVVFSLKNWRCPACDRYLGKGMSPRFCPKCGVALR